MNSVLRWSAALSIATCAVVGCASAPIRPVPPPLQAPHESGIFVSAFNGDPALDHKVAGAHVVIDGNKASETDGAGNTFFDGLVDGVHRFTLEAPGFEPAAGDFTLPQSDPLNVALTKAISTAHQQGQLHVCGSGFPERHDFCDQDGQRWPFKGKATYTIISEIAKGHDVGWFFDEAIAEGANTVVALGMDGGDWARSQDFYIDPRASQWDQWVRTLFETADVHHMRVYFAVFQQAQILNDAEQRAVWQHACDIARGRWNVLLAEGNEDDVNNWKHDSLPRCNGDMGGVLVSTGSRGINNPPTPPNFDFATWEPRRDPFAKAIDDAGAGAWEMYSGYPGFPAVPMPMVVIEPPFFYESAHDIYGDFRWFEPWKALRLGLSIGVNFAGGTFGSSQSLETKPDGPIATECARQFFRGITTGFQR